MDRSAVPISESGHLTDTVPIPFPCPQPVQVKQNLVLVNLNLNDAVELNALPLNLSLHE